MNYLTAADVAEKLNISKTRVLLHIRAGRLKATPIGKMYLIDPKDFEEFKKYERKPGRPPAA